MGVGRGAGIWKFQQKMLFSWFRVPKTKFHHFWPPWKNFWKNPLVALPGEIPSDAHAHKRVKWHYFCEKLCCITPSGNTVQQHQCGKQAIAGWQTVHGVFCQTITKSYQINCHITNKVRNIIEKILPKFCNDFFIKHFTLSLYPILIVLLKLTIFRQKSGGLGPPRKKSGGT